MAATATAMVGSSAIIAGVDEVGRGPLAGPVVTAAVILDPSDVPDGLADSKTLSAARREALFGSIVARARSVSLASASAAEIDSVNIRVATLACMARSVRGLSLTPELVLVDGRDVISVPMHCRAIIRGDSSEAAIAAASIVAKVVRDRMMARLHRAFPAYGFADHAGYGTALHRAAIEAHGPCALHRYSFVPIKGRWQRSP
ncbi:MAG: ribonuclease HII [Hyphomicrobiales bacterium]|nr:ribonuclease HII [Hyphomicrobiales bacterium]